MKTPDTWNEDMERNEELMNMNTPDTEWEKILDIVIEEWAVDICMEQEIVIGEENRKDLVNRLKKRFDLLLTSRDTYWKERVRKEVENVIDENDDGMWGCRETLDILLEKLIKTE